MRDPLISDTTGWIIFAINLVWALFVLLMILFGGWPLWMLALVAINTLTAGVLYRELTY